MRPQRTIALAAVLILAISAVGLTTTTGSHDQRIDQRIVHPYNVQVITHIPIVAGYEPFPAAPMCAAGGADLLAFYEEDFSTGLNGWEFVGTPLSSRSMQEPGSWGYNNLWTLTDWGGTRGTDAGQEGENRLYFGLTSGPRAGTYNAGHSAGTAQSPAIQLPDGPSILAYENKWEMEYLMGYDHMFVEILDEDDKIHLICSNNSAGRADQAGVNGQSAYQSCSPFLSSPCANFGVGASQFPAWETRHIAIPQPLWGQEVNIRFTFDTSDGAANGFHGWSIADVAVGAPLAP